MRSCCLLILVFLLSYEITSVCFAQSLVHKSYTAKDGLPSNQINALFQDSRGCLWIGTNNGLSMYDGATFTNYSTVNGLPNSWITDIIESRFNPGTLYLGTIAGGVSKFHDGLFTPVFLDSSDDANVVEQIVEDSMGVVWCATAGGIYTVATNTSTLVQPGSGAESSGWSLAETPSGRTWVARGNRINIYGGRNVSLLTFQLPLRRGAHINCMSASSSGDVWVGTSDSMVFRCRDSAIIGSYKVGFGDPYYLREESNKVLWIRTVPGVARLMTDNPGSVSLIPYKVQDRPPGDWAGPVLVDREANLWIGCWERGLQKAADKNLSRIRYSSEFPSLLDRQGHGWVTMEGTLVELYSDEQGIWRNYTHRFPRKVFGGSLEYDRLGRLWITLHDTTPVLRCYEIIARKERPSLLRAVTEFRRNVDIPPAVVLSSFLDRDQHLWLGLDNWTVVVLDVNTRRTLRTYRQKDGVPGNSVRAIYQDSHKNIWLGGWDGGLSVLHDEAVSHGAYRKFTTADGLPDNRIRSLHEDRDGKLWIGTRHGGLALYTGSGFRTISMKDGLLSNSIWGIADDDEHRLWLWTDAGVECIDRSTLTPIAPRNEFVGEALLSLGIFNDRFLYWSTFDGLTIFDYKNDHHDAIPPLVHISSLVVDGRQVDESARKGLPYDQNNCTFSFLGISFSDERAIHYRYRLLGLDSAWTGLTTQRGVTYASLRPGSYIFQVEAFNRDGVRSSEPASIMFFISSPYWQRWWFLAVTGLMFTGTIAGLARYFSVQKLRRRVLDLEREQAIIEERTRTRERIASDLHDDVASTLSSIAFFAESLKRRLAGSSDDLRILLHKISALSLEAEDAVGDIVWSVAPQHDTLQELVVRMRDFGSDLCAAQGIDFNAHFEQPDQPVRLDDALRKNIYLIFKEGMNNIVKHSQARLAQLSVLIEDGKLHLTLVDDGTGFILSNNSTREERGHGLRNMTKRAQDIAGRLSIESSPKKGTRIVLETRMT